MSKKTMNHYKNALVLGIAVAGLFTVQAGAAGLQVATSDGASLGVRTAAGEFGFTVRNDGPGRLDQVRLRSDRQHPVSCADLTAQGRHFAFGESLQAGDSVQCMGQSREPARSRAGNVAVIARDASGNPVSRQATFAQPAAVMPQQAIAIVTSGAVHNDTNGNGLLDPGETIAYHYTLLNLGTLALSGLTLTDIGGNVTCPQSTLAVNASMTCTRSYSITVSDQANGMVVNQIDLRGVDSGGGPILAGDLVVSLDRGGNAGIRVFKSPFLLDDADNSGYASAGDRLRYNFVLKNSGGQTLTAVNLVEPDPSLIDTSITCNTSTLAGRPFGALGSSSLQSNDVVLCAAEHVVTAAEGSAGVVRNLAEVSGQPGIGGPVYGSGASAVIAPTLANVSVVKALVGESGSRPGIAEPNELLTYQLTLSNSGGATAFNVGLVDPLDVNTSFVSASNGGVEAGGVVTWTGLTVPAGGSINLTVTVRVASPLPAGVTQIANLAYLPGTTPPNCSAAPLPGACSVIPTIGSIAVNKSLTGESGSMPGFAEPGEQLTYTILLTNTGGSPVTGYSLTDPLDPNVSFISASNGGTLVGNEVRWSGISLGVGQNLALTVVVQVNTPVAIGVTHILNLAYESGTTPPDCTAQPLPSACVDTPMEPRPVIQVTKTVDSPTVSQGGTAIYTITVTNVSSVTITNAVVSDPEPPGFATFTWVCQAFQGAVCGNGSGTGSINETVPLLPPGGRVEYIVTAAVLPLFEGPIVNGVTVTPSSYAVCMPANVAPPCQATVPITVPYLTPRDVPANDPRLLALLALGLGLGASRVLRRRT